MANTPTTRLPFELLLLHDPWEPYPGNWTRELRPLILFLTPGMKDLLITLKHWKSTWPIDYPVQVLFSLFTTNLL